MRASLSDALRAVRDDLEVDLRRGTLPMPMTKGDLDALSDAADVLAGLDEAGFPLPAVDTEASMDAYRDGDL